MATTDIRLDRIKHEYTGVRDAQDALMDRIDTYEGALLGLTEMVAANHELTQRQIAELNLKIDAMMKHLDIPYKPPAGFIKE